MKRNSDRDHVVSQGRLSRGSWCVDYYTTAPTPTQWIAVGVLKCCATGDDVYRPRKMIVGKGRNERDSVDDLDKRFEAFRHRDEARTSPLQRRLREREAELNRPAIEPVVADRQYEADSRSHAH